MDNEDLMKKLAKLSAISRPEGLTDKEFEDRSYQMAKDFIAEQNKPTFTDFLKAQKKKKEQSNDTK